MINIIWKRFWRLIVLKKWIKTKHYNQYYICKCDCWKEKEIAYSSLSTWISKSCWCLRKEQSIKRFTKHWMRNTRFYNIFFNIKKRCEKENNPAYKNYWWRWIKCEWKTFEWFYKDMIKWYSKELTLDRINNDWDYCKENCKWSTRKEQANNKRSNIVIIHEWVSKTFFEWIDYLKLNKHTIESRVYGLGWDYKKALFTSIRKKENGKNAK